MKIATVVLALCALCALCASCAIFASIWGIRGWDSQNEDVDLPPLFPSTASNGSAGEFEHLDLPGISRPRLLPVSHAKISVSADVIGVSVGGLHRAYTIRAMSAVDQHAVNDMFGSTPITVTYCDRTNCARVLTSDDSESQLDIGIGGYLWAKNGGLVLWHGGEHYVQTGDDLPFEDVKFERIRWLDWVAAHPDTLLFDGPAPDDPTS